MTEDAPVHWANGMKNLLPQKGIQGQHEVSCDASWRVAKGKQHCIASVLHWCGLSVRGHQQNRTRCGPPLDL